MVLLSHAGEGTDMKLAAEVPGIDVIVGGHSHSRMPIGEIVWRGDDLKQNDVNGTVIVQAFQWGGELGTAGPAVRTGQHRAPGVSAVTVPGSCPSPPDMPADPMVAAVVDRLLAADCGPFGEVVGPCQRRLQQPRRRRRAL